MEVVDFQKYLIYDDGRVWSKRGKGKFLKPNINSGGYKQVILYNDNVRKVLLIHRLIGLNYIPNPCNKTQVDHIDRDKLNNSIDNLRWLTHSENSRNKGIRGEVQYRGVSKVNDKFRSRIFFEGKTKSLGTYRTAEEASNVYNEFCINNNLILAT